MNRHNTQRRACHRGGAAMELAEEVAAAACSPPEGDFKADGGPENPNRKPLCHLESTREPCESLHSVCHILIKQQEANADTVLIQQTNIPQQ